MQTGGRGQTLEIFVPYWGEPRFLYATLDSIRAQTTDLWTAVVVDDCYPDPSVAEYFDRLGDSRIRYVRNEHNLGTTGNYERCRDMASRELMMFMGSDDLMHPNFVATVLAAHDAFPEAAVIEVGVRVIDENDRLLAPLADKVKRSIMPRASGLIELKGEDLAASLLRGDWLYWPSLVFRTHAVRSQPFRSGLPIIQDLAFVVDLAVAGESLVLDPTICFSYRRHGTSISASSIFGGSRFADERRYYALAAEQMRLNGWRRARRTAALRWTSRLHGLALIPTAVRQHRWQSVPPLLAHAFAP